MNDLPVLTIITITYNAERFLGRTLTSVQAALDEVKDPRLVEYLVIDGKSGDNTLKIASTFSFISKIISEPDSGLYDAMNKGLALARGKYVWFLNAGDEIFDPNTLKGLLEAFENNADVYYSDAMLVRENGSEVGLRSQFTPHILPLNLKWQDFALGMKVCHQAFIVRKSIAPTYDIENLSADIDWEIECLKKSTEIHFIKTPLCRYLVGGLSIKNHRRSLIDRFKVLHKHFGLIPSIFNHLRIFWRGAIFARTHGKYW
ncbi:glycosyltransferase [Dyadobacter chenwenxiniae]|uniref:Glycosyltransferase n=1 Tax=Dyadobacter chenwenxiniae TaxID=2906456 RepID=A0A9X1TCQ3_9BACT|nr:glycosyltransferase [Dyadobacter chenwenxiniae]MCF0061106.1 glycosyltransferase [Dyadobacter chenwenxiniae]UON80933.1 glycosyltransferase [Dyadobacter chenwenxiniae]